MTGFKPGSTSWKAVCGLVCAMFVAALVAGDLLRLRRSDAVLPGLPAPTQMVTVSPAYTQPLLKGLRLDPADPLNVDFIIDTADAGKVSAPDAEQLIRYFLAALTTPDEDLWVNLSPYEQDRIIPDSLTETDLGRDLLAQDYVLKQLASSLTHPETDIGREYWRLAGDDTSNKVWIEPDQVEVYEHDAGAVITRATLKVRTESPAQEPLVYDITRDVNTGRSFTALRRIYHAVILAQWFKHKFRESFFRHYIDQAKTAGIDTSDPALKQKIFNLYVESFKKGVYDIIRSDSASDQFSILDSRFSKNRRRRFFSGGVAMERTLAGSSLKQAGSALELAQAARATARGRLVVSSAILEKETSLRTPADTDTSMLNTQVGFVGPQQKDLTVEADSGLNRQFQGRVQLVQGRIISQGVFEQVMALRNVDFLLQHAVYRHQETNNGVIAALRHIFKVQPKETRRDNAESLMKGLIDQAKERRKEGHIFKRLTDLLTPEQELQFSRQAVTGDTQDVTLAVLMADHNLMQIPQRGIPDEVYRVRVAHEQKRLARVKTMIETYFDMAMNEVKEIDEERKGAVKEVIRDLSIKDGEWAEYGMIKLLGNDEGSLSSKIKYFTQMKAETDDKNLKTTCDKIIGTLQEARDIVSDYFWELLNQDKLYTQALSDEFYANIAKRFEMLRDAVQEKLTVIDGQDISFEERHSEVFSLSLERRKAVRKFLELCRNELDNRPHNSYRFILLEDVIAKMAALHPEWYRMYRPLFQKIADELVRSVEFRYRLIDQRGPEINDRAVVLALNFVPGPTLYLDMRRHYGAALKAIITTAGGTGAHYVLEAKADDMPVVIIDENSFRRMESGENIIYFNGRLVASAEPQTFEEFVRAGEMQTARRNADKAQAENSRFRVSANADTPDQVRRAIERGATGIGLVRVENLITDDDGFVVPSVAGFEAKFAEILDAARGHDVTFRDIDLGADKKPNALFDVTYAGDRFCFDDHLGKEISFAIICALERLLMRGKSGMRYMPPKVERRSDLEEKHRMFEHARRLVSVEDASGVPLIPIGAMIETPQAVDNIDDILSYPGLKFISWGTNDLTNGYFPERGRYEPNITMRAEVEKKFSLMRPLLMRKIAEVSRKAADKRVEISMCGDMASMKRFWPVQKYMQEEYQVTIVPSMASDPSVYKAWKVRAKQVTDTSMVSVRDAMRRIEMMQVDDREVEALDQELNDAIDRLNGLVDEASSALDPFGGIDLKNIDVQPAAGSSAIELARVDLEDLSGFRFELIEMHDLDTDEKLLAAFD